MADVSVRPATPADVPDIARIQVETWKLAYRDLLPADVLAELTPAAAEPTWAAAVGTPPSERHRVLVAREGEHTVGFVAFGPVEAADLGAADDNPDAARTAVIRALLVEPRWGRRGHGSRLLAAGVDLLRADGITGALVWLPEDDRISTAFYAGAGWQRDGWARTLEDAGRSVREARFHVSLEDGE